MILITPQKEIISIIAKLIVNKDFSNEYYFSLYSRMRNNEIHHYVLIVEDVNSVNGELADIVSKLSQIKVIRFDKFISSETHNLLMTNKDKSYYENN